MIISDWLLQESEENVKNIPKRIYNPKSLKQIARKKLKKMIKN